MDALRIDSKVSKVIQPAHVSSGKPVDTLIYDSWQTSKSNIMCGSGDMELGRVAPKCFYAFVSLFSLITSNYET